MLKRLIKHVSNNKLFVAIVILAAVLRFSYIDYLPPSLNWDEVSHGYNAYSILKTGKDEWGVTFPTIFRAYGDYKLPVYIYLTAISEFFFGLNPFSVRLPSVLAGITTVIFTYLLAKELFNSKSQITRPHRIRGSVSGEANYKSLAALAALFVAVEPWSLFLSRGAFEANLALAFIVSGVYFFLKGLRVASYPPASPAAKRWRTGLLPATILLGLSVWTYNSARIFVPLFLVLLIYLYKQELKNLWRKNRKLITYHLLLIAIFFVPMFWQLLNPAGQARYGRVAILDEGAIAQINEARVTSDLSPGFARLAHNKATFFIGKFAKNWVSHFTGNFLFFQGGSHYQFSVPGQGLLYSINAIFLTVGTFYLLRKRSREAMLVLGWFFLGPIASSLTREAPHVLRSITMLPAPVVITAAGFVASWNWLKERNKNFAKVLVPTYLIILLFHFENYAQRTVVEYRDQYSWAWQYGYKQVVDYAKQNYDKYDKIVVTKKYGEPHEFFLFFWRWDPEAYRSDPNLNRFYQSNWYWVDGFDKFYFVNDWEIPRDPNEPFLVESGLVIDCAGQECLLVTSPGNFPGGWNKLKTINFLDGKQAFDILEN